MPNDYLTLTALARELDTTLRGGRIEKIYQPEKDEITLAIHTASGKHNLVISCNAQAPRIHISTAKKENPLTAPTFCMHLRKLLSSGNIESVSLLNLDRIVNISIISKNELKDTVKYSLIFEMMGRYSNIILINGNNTILDAVKQVSFDTATKRCLLPSMKYSCPEQSKIAPQDYEAIRAALAKYTSDSLAKYLCANVSGLSIQSAEELTYSVGNTLSSPSDIDKVITRFQTFYDINNSAEYHPCVLKNEEGLALDYFITPYHSQGDNYEILPSLSSAIEACVARRDTDERHREKSKHLQSALKKYISKNEKKLQKANEKLIECDKIDLYRKYGELITSNLYAIHRGDESLTCVDYYEENAPTITIPLSKQFSPTQVAQDYFKRYNKLKRTLALIGGQIQETKDALEYAKSIDSSLAISSSNAELFQIEEELFNIGALKKIKTTLPKSTRKAEPFTFEYKDFVIMVGKNNIQNEKLTFKLANGGDTWLHALGYHGSHAVIFAEARDIPSDVLTLAAEITAYYSDGRAADKVAIDYTLRKNVKRSPSGNIGMVTYDNQSTAYVKPDPHEECKLS